MKTTASNNNGLPIFKHTAETNSSNDFKYLKPKIFNRYVSIKKIKSNFKNIESKAKFKKQQEKVLKEIHKYRVSKLKNIHLDIKYILKIIEDVNVLNRNSNFVIVANTEDIEEKLYEMNTDSSKVEEIIKDGFCIGDNDENIKLITNDQNIKKMLAEDFFVKMKLLIAKADTPKAIKFLHWFVMDLPEKDILSKNKIASLSKQLHNKTQQLTKSLIEKKVDYAKEGDKLLSEIHAFTVICDKTKVFLSKKQREKLVDLCMKCFDQYATATLNKENYLNIRGQINYLKQQKEHIVKPIIKILYNNTKKYRLAKIKQADDYIQSISDTLRNKAENFIIFT